MKYLDVGGGLGIDYDGSQTDFESSVNYTLQEYANDVVFRIKSVCDEAGVPHPTIISESGRAVVAYHSVLVFDVLGVSQLRPLRGAADELPDDAPQPMPDLFAIHRDLNKKNLLESYHDAVQAVDEALNLFNLGYLTIEQRALAERLFWAVVRQAASGSSASWTTCPRSCRASRRCCRTPTSATSRSSSRCPTRWAIKQLFPIMPIHRLDEPPTRRAVLGDITCDSDGKVDQFIDLRDVRNDAGAAPLQRRAVLPGGVPARGLPGDPRRPAQPVRRHQRRPRQPGRRRRGRTSTRSSRATRCARCCTTCSTRPTS